MLESEYRLCRISIHAPPRGATTARMTTNYRQLKFQFTPLREGRPTPRSFLRFAYYFNSRPSARGDSCFSAPKTSLYISIHAPPRGATLKTSRSCPTRKLISIHAPPRGATEGEPRLWFVTIISIHAPPRGATETSECSSKRENQISIHAPPRGATKQRDVFMSCVKISIHAPPRGATKTHWGRPRRHRISIHAPPRGATFPLRWQCGAFSFQFTPLREGRHYIAIGAIGSRDISIHAPPRGATNITGKTKNSR